MMKKERSIFRELEWLQIEELQDADRKAVALRKEAVFMWSTLCRSRVCGSISCRLQIGKKCTLKNVQDIQRPVRKTSIYLLDKI